MFDAGTWSDPGEDPWEVGLAGLALARPRDWVWYAMVSVNTALIAIYAFEDRRTRHAEYRVHVARPLGAGSRDPRHDA